MNNKKTEICVCIGTGGVGKTTVSSMMAMHYAKKGLRSLVLTVDPAKRLLDILNIKKNTAKPQRVKLDQSTYSGEMHAFMPDLESEWLDFLNSSISDKKLCNTIANNHFYQYMAKGFPGSLEIICCHIMFKLMNSQMYDIIILDTPPASHSLAFFDVPQKISSVFEQNIFQMLIKKRSSILVRLTKKIALFSGGLLEKTLEKIIGSHFLSELIDFALTIDLLYEPMHKRALAMKEFLADSGTKYNLVISPTGQSIGDYSYLLSSLNSRGLNLNDIIINQLLPETDELELKAELDLLNKNDKNISEILRAAKYYMARYELEQKIISNVRRDFPNNDVYKLFRYTNSKKTERILEKLLFDYENR